MSSFDKLTQKVSEFKSMQPVRAGEVFYLPSTDYKEQFSRDLELFFEYYQHILLTIENILINTSVVANFQTLRDQQIFDLKSISALELSAEANMLEPYLNDKEKFTEYMRKYIAVFNELVALYQELLKEQK